MIISEDLFSSALPHTQRLTLKTDFILNLPSMNWMLLQKIGKFRKEIKISGI